MEKISERILKLYNRMSAGESHAQQPKPISDMRSLDGIDVHKVDAMLGRIRGEVTPAPQPVESAKPWHIPWKVVGVLGLILGLVAYGESEYLPVVIKANVGGSQVGVAQSGEMIPVVEIVNGGAWGVAFLPRDHEVDWHHSEIVPDCFMKQGELLDATPGVEFSVPPREPSQEFCVSEYEVAVSNLGVWISVRYLGEAVGEMLE